MKKYISVLIISIISILSFSNIAFAMESNVYPEGDSRAEQSNGAGMAQNLAVRCSDIFAAAALGAPAYFDEEYFGPVDNIHEMAIIFSYGSEDEYLKEFHMTADINDIPAIRHLEYWRGLYGFDQDFLQKGTKEHIHNVHLHNQV